MQKSRLGDSMESLGRDFCVCGGGGWSGDLMGKGYMGVMCKNI